MFSQQLLGSDNVFDLVSAIPKHIATTFEVSQVALFLKDHTYYSGDAREGRLDAPLKTAAAEATPRFERTLNASFIPLRFGARSMGSIGLSGCEFSRETLEAIGSLTAIAIERASAVETLAKTEAARESDRLRSVLLDSVTHAFRTPLTAIKASAETLLSGAALDKTQRNDLLSVINEESDRIDHLIGEAAEVAQLDSHQLELHLEARPVRDAIDAAVEASRISLQLHPLRIEVPHDLPAVRMDTARIAEALSQLLDNAAKYSPAGSEIRIAAEPRENYVAVTIADTGPGIEEAEREMIFAKFYRGHNQRMLTHGTGMGLAIAKAIVELHAGTIGVSNQTGKGAVFYFALPVA